MDSITALDVAVTANSQAASALFARSQLDFHITLRTELLSPSGDGAEIVQSFKNAWTVQETLVGAQSCETEVHVND